MIVTTRTNKADYVNIVIPVFNEGENFPFLWEEITRQVNCPFKIWIIYDFDEDNTLPVIRKITNLVDVNHNPSETRINLVKNTGKGVAQAIYTGFANIEQGPVLLVMADLSDDLALVSSMLKLYNEGYDVVVGSRYMSGGKIINGPLVKQTLSRLAGISLHYLRRVPTHDATNAFKLCDKDMLTKLNLTSTSGFALTIEITVKAFLNNYNITQIPATWRTREFGKSKFAMFKWLPEYLYWYLFAFQPIKR